MFVSESYPEYDPDWDEPRDTVTLGVFAVHCSLSLAHPPRLLARQEKFTPAKYFSIDRVFRNETLDATHLAEFHQIEGLVADYGLTLGDLMGILHQFFIKLGQDGCMAGQI